MFFFSRFVFRLQEKYHCISSLAMPPSVSAHPTNTHRVPRNRNLVLDRIFSGLIHLNSKFTIRIVIFLPAPQDGVNGFCVGVGDKEGYVTGLRKLVQDRDERSKVHTVKLQQPLFRDPIYSALGTGGFPVYQRCLSESVPTIPYTTLSLKCKGTL